MDNQLISLMALNIYVMLLILIQIKKRRKKVNKRWANRRWWVHPINTHRNILGYYNTIFHKLKNYPEKFFNFTRMSLEVFNKLLNKVTPFLEKTSHRESLSPEHRLIITLRYLATGDEISSIALEFRTGKSTIHKIIQETTTVIANILISEYIKPPNEIKWKEISNGFYKDWNMPNCVGAVDGKHVEIQAPPNTGSMCFNYKKTFSTVLLAACDHAYKFTLIDIGAYGSESDGGIFSRSSFGQAIEKEALNLPKNEVCLPNSNIKSHYFFVGDEAFKISCRMMRPYPAKNLTIQQKVFNYRLSRARRVIENAFGILVARWRIFKKPINKSLNNVEKIIAACVSLHNFIMIEEKNGRQYLGRQLIDLENNCENFERYQNQNIESGLRPLVNSNSHRSTAEAYTQRDNINTWMMNQGQVPWQLEYVFRGSHENHE